MVRHQNWPSILAEYFRDCEHERFMRGHYDCALFAGRAIDLMTGSDFCSEFADKYTTKKGATELIKKKGYKNLEDLATKKLGVPLSNIKMAQRGDCISFDATEGVALGIVDLSGAKIAAAAKDGIQFLPMACGRKAWRV